MNVSIAPSGIQLGSFSAQVNGNQIRGLKPFQVTYDFHFAKFLLSSYHVLFALTFITKIKCTFSSPQ